MYYLLRDTNDMVVVMLDLSVLMWLVLDLDDWLANSVRSSLGCRMVEAKRDALLAALEIWSVSADFCIVAIDSDDKMKSRLTQDVLNSNYSLFQCLYRNRFPPMTIGNHVRPLSPFKSNFKVRF